jgi:hypothetical protein
VAAWVWENQLTQRIFNTDSDKVKLGFPYNNHNSQLHIISKQSCHWVRYMPLFQYWISSAIYIPCSQLFYYSCTSSCHCWEVVWNFNSVTVVTVTVLLGNHVGCESCGQSIHVHQLIEIWIYKQYVDMTSVSAECNLHEMNDIFLMRLVLQQLPSIHHHCTEISMAPIWSLTIVV